MRTGLSDGVLGVRMMLEEGRSMKRQTRSSLLTVCALGALVFCSRAVSAGTVTWTGLGTGGNATWTNAANWDTGIPATTDDVVIASGWTSGTPAIGGSTNSPVVVNSLTVKDTTVGDVSAGGGGYLQLTSGTINRSANPTEAHSFNFTASQLYLPPATNNWFLGATGLNFNVMSHIGPIGGSGAMTIVKTGASVLVPNVKKG